MQDQAYVLFATKTVEIMILSIKDIYLFVVTTALLKGKKRKYFE